MKLSYKQLQANSKDSLTMTYIVEDEIVDLEPIMHNKLIRH